MEIAIIGRPMPGISKIFGYGVGGTEHAEKPVWGPTLESFEYPPYPKICEIPGIGLPIIAIST